MGAYKYIRDLWKQPKNNLGELWTQRLISWRTEPATVRIDYPTRLDRARSLGYKAKPGFILVRQKVLRGGHMREKFKGGRDPKNSRRRMVLNKTYQGICEQRAKNKYPNCEVLNSYYVADDGMHYWYEVILVDKAHPQIVADKNINWICDVKGRVERGLTSSGRKVRGLRHKGKGAEQLRPSKHAANLRKIGTPRKYMPRM